MWKIYYHLKKLVTVINHIAFHLRGLLDDNFENAIEQNMNQSMNPRGIFG